MEASQFKSIFLPCHQKLYTVAWSLTGNAQSAEDLVQETFLRLWTKRNQIGHIENAETYSLTTLRHIFYDIQRTKHIAESETDIGQMPQKVSEDMSKQIEVADECERIRQLINRLPDPQGKIMMMRDIEERPYNEISAVTGISETNIRAILSRARKKIREQIKEKKR